MNQRRMAALVVGSMTMIGVTAAPAHAASPPRDEAVTVASPDNLPNRLADKQNALRQAAVDNLIQGKATPETVKGKRVLKVEGKDKSGKDRDRYVEYDVNQRASILSFLVEFGDKTSPAQGGAPGPLHTRSRSPTARSTATRRTITRRCGCRTSTRSTTRT